MIITPPQFTRFLTNDVSFNPPVSDSAREVARDLHEISQSFDRTISLRPPNWGVKDTLLDLMNETQAGGWDGGDAEPVRVETIAQAWAFVQALPPNLPVPEISAEPDGDVALDWIQDRERLISVSVRHNGEIHYAGIFGGGRKVHGADVFGGEVPAVVLSAIEQVLGRFGE